MRTGRVLREVLMRCGVWLPVWGWLCLVLSVAAQEGPSGGDEGWRTRWEEALVAMDQGQYDRAAQALENLLATHGMSAPALHNLALSRYQMGELAAALALWECARELTPRDPEIRSGLRWVHQRLGVRDRSPGRWLLEGWPMQAFSIGLLVGVWGWAGWSAWSCWTGGRTGAAGRRVLGGVVGVGVLVLAIRVGWRQVRPNARVVVEEARVFQAPVAEARVVGRLLVLREVTLVRRRGDWWEVREGRQRLGWVMSGDLVATLPEVELERRRLVP
jgi:hypothetical protein